MTALIIHATKQLSPSLLAILKRANIELRPIPITADGVAEADNFSHLHDLTAEQEKHIQGSDQSQPTAILES